MKKMLSLLLIAAILLIGLSMPISVSAESLYIRKIVSVVYDDSGSMKGDKWAYANYAMQAFCGMLNSEDRLFITYMSQARRSGSYTSEEIDLSAGGIKSSVDSIRRHTDSWSTPYSSVEAAYDKLKSVNDSNPNTQYWLVVITDGEFDECNSMSDDQTKSFLNDNFREYADSVMPNGTHPQVTFLGIGDVLSPREDQSRGIFTYSASSAAGIIKAMSDMADKISGRTRLQKSNIKKLDDKTIQVSSSIPLLNIAVFSQGSRAEVTQAVFGNELTIPISRSVSLGYSGYSELVGGAFLIGDSQAVIGSGVYNITFDRAIELSDVIILFEPALEARMTITVNGNEISDIRELENTMEGDKISVSCKICEMGTDTEVAPSLMPSGTEFELIVSEDGKVVERTTDKAMRLGDHVLKNVNTEITASVTIEGFNPIESSVRFTPTEYVKKIVYTIDADYGSDVRNVKLDDIATNNELSICFTVYADGVAMTDPNAVRALRPIIDVAPQGNGGEITYSGDGRIVFTPNAASAPQSNDGSFNVDVTCTIDDGTSASKTYTVLIAEYKVIATDAVETVKKTELYGNTVSVSFYITKDGVKLDKSAVEKHIAVLVNKEYSELELDVSLAEDGTITVTPRSNELHELNFWTWWTNWAYYFGLEDDDITVTLDHAFGTANGVIDIVGEDASYLIFNVYLPLLIEIVLVAFLTAWVILIVTKPRYLKSATLYVGTIRFNSGSVTHTVRNFSAVKLDKFNKIKKGHGRLKFKRTADVVSANGIKIRADRGGRIICEMAFPWYKSRLEPVDIDLSTLRTPGDIATYFERNNKLEIREFATTVTVSSELERTLAPSSPRMAKYIVVPDPGGVAVVDGRRVIRSGKLFVYIN